MKTFTTVEQAINFAINSATECAEFFNHFSNRARNGIIRRQFAGYSRNEYAQIAKLSVVLREYPAFISQAFSTSLSDERIEKAQCHGSSNLNYLQTLIMAMRRSQLARTLFTELASQSPDQESHDIFMSLAQKESTQLNGIAYEYNESLLVFS
ncbi:MAG: hypothetical protein RBR28_02210 [Lentimicrobium sp.]|jgi:rubrerythrin|nr:hypothetical protein [Lentimicrobium sp.]